jgi:hypothetical protein
MLVTAPSAPILAMAECEKLPIVATERARALLECLSAEGELTVAAHTLDETGFARRFDESLHVLGAGVAPG